jgi:hypothetical protein
MEEDLIDAATIFELNHTDSIYQSCHQIVKEGILPITRQVFVPKLWDYPIQFQLWMEAVRFFIRHKLLELQYMKANMHLTLTNTDSCIQLTFYPIGALAPTLHLRNDGRYFLTYTFPSIYAQAAMAKIEGKSMKVKASKIKDPSIEEIGDPRNLNNYLPDSGATQHMTPRLADLQNTVEGQKLVVEVANGHIIKCSTTGNIQISMQDDNGNMLNATLSDVMYVPGLNRRLFSVTQFAQHGHHTIVQQHGTTLLFSACLLPITIPHHKNGRIMASNLSVTNSTNKDADPCYHRVPAYRNKDQDKKTAPSRITPSMAGTP